MPQAAVVGSNTSHGTTLTPGPGSPNVRFGGQPAWRAREDKHKCPLSDSSKPHVGGVVLEGSFTVFINGFPAARAGDKVTEASPTPNIISPGKIKVLIG